MQPKPHPFPFLPKNNSQAVIAPEGRRRTCCQRPGRLSNLTPCFILALSLYFLGRHITDRPDFPHISPYFCQKVLEAGRDIAFCPVRMDTGKLSQYQEIYSTERSYEFAVRAVPPACLDFPGTE